MGATDKNGGDLYLASATATGTGSSNIYLQTAGGGAGGTTDRAVDTKMTILGNGYVGIGTTSPTNLFSLHNNNGNTYAQITNSTTGNPATNHGVEISLVANDFYVWNYEASGTVRIGTAGVERFTVLNTGNIGLATTSPTNLLSLGGNSARTIWMERHTTANTAGNNLTVQSGGATVGATDKNGGDLYLASATATGTGSSNIYLQTATAGGAGTADRAVSTKVSILGNGNVGIGTTGPTSKLEVSGGDIRVTTGSFIDDGTTLTVPDYVFETGYNLMPIADLRKYVSQYKHLPNVPDMNDIAGWAKLSLQDRDMRLLEKIEENSLYIMDNAENIASLTQNVSGLTDNQNKIVEQLTGQLADQNLSADAKIQLIGKNLDDLNNKQIKKIKEQIEDLDEKISSVETRLIASLQETIDKQRTDIIALQGDMELLKIQNQAVIDFSLALNMESLIYKDSLGNLDILEGKITAKDIEALNTIKAKDIEAETVKLEDKKTAGKNGIVAGETETEIETPYASKDVKIYITPEGSTYGKILYFDEIKEGESFKIKIDEPALADKDIKFNWLIIK